MKDQQPCSLGVPPERNQAREQLLGEYFRQQAVAKVFVVPCAGDGPIRVVVARNSARPVILTHRIRGIDCEAIVVDQEDLTALLEGRLNAGRSWDFSSYQVFSAVPATGSVDT